MITIPDSVLSKIQSHRPHLAPLVKNLRGAPSAARQIEKAIADAYLQGEVKITGEKLMKLSACCAGRGYGELCF